MPADLEQSVSGLQTPIFNSGTTRQNVLDVDRTVSILQIVSRCYAESKTIRTYSMLQCRIK